MAQHTARKEFLLVLAFYAFMALAYFSALVVDTGIWRHYWAVFFNHLFKALLTLPIWWFFFKKVAHLAIWQKGLLHLITMPLFTYVWVISYYAFCDAIGFHRLQGSREVWDYYITVLFYCIQFGIFHLYAYAKAWRAQQILAEQLAKLNAQSELSALKAQLNPHFLYNVFNTINAAIPTTAKHARNMVTELSDLFRYQLKASREELVPLAEELDFVSKYLDLEKERFGERLRYRIDCEMAVSKMVIPPLIIQPLVENAIKHGIAPLIEGGKVHVSVVEKENQLEVSVQDTGAGATGKSMSDLLQQGVGLSNTHERLKKMYGKGLQVVTDEIEGFTVRFQLPNQIDLHA